jgi:hypothetical protein
MNPQATISARPKGKYLVHFYNNDVEDNINCDSLEYALDLVAGFHKAVARNAKVEIPAFLK